MDTRHEIFWTEGPLETVRQVAPGTSVLWPALNWTGVCKPEGRIYRYTYVLPHLEVGLSRRALCCVFNLPTLPHDGSLLHLDISDWLVCCLAMACARSSLCFLCSSAFGHSTSTGRWTLFRDLEDGAWSPADSHNVWLSQAIS